MKTRYWALFATVLCSSTACGATNPSPPTVVNGEVDDKPSFRVGDQVRGVLDGYIGVIESVDDWSYNVKSPTGELRLYGWCGVESAKASDGE